MADPLKALLQLERMRDVNKLSIYKPYPFQQRFHHAEGYRTPGRLAFQRFVVAANKVGKCASISVKIETPQGPKKIGDLFGSECEVLTWPDLEPRKVKAWVRKPAEECFRITMSDGQWVEVPKGHRILTSCGYVSAGLLFEHLPKSVFCHPPSKSVFVRLAHALGVLNCMRNIRDYLDGCSLDYRLGDVPLLSDEDNVQVYAPSPDGVLKRKGLWSYVGGLANRCKRILSRLFYRLSSLGGGFHSSVRFALPEYRVVSGDGQCRTCCTQNVRQSSTAGHPGKRVPGERFRQSESFSLSVVPVIEGNRIVSVYSVGVKRLYDMEVDDRHHYIAGGLIHHNTWAAAMEVAMHATGRYPDWWKGHRLLVAPTIMCGSNTNETVRDICQRELLGDPEDDKRLGTGAVPADCIGKLTRKAGVPNAVDSVLIRHVSGKHSKISFRAYEQGFKKFMGHSYDVNWVDEEPPQDIWSQVNRSTFSRPSALIIATFTPEEGMTELVTQVFNDIQTGQALIQATWDDAPHMTKEIQEARLATIPLHEREMRSKGIPLSEAGLIFPFVEDDFVVDPFEIPRHWPQIIGIDFGWDHPFGAAKLAWDRDADTVYIVADYRESKVIPAVHAETIRSWGDWVPVAWPHDGLNTEKGTGESLIRKYRELNLATLPNKATLPPPPGGKEGDGSNSVEESILEMYERLQSKRLRVFKTCKYWLEERRMYHRDNKGKLVKKFDDTISASRYALMMLRHARINMKPRAQKIRRGATNW